MLNLLKTSAVAAVVATVPFAASALTLMTDGGSAAVVLGESYLSDTTLATTGGAGEWAFTFIADEDDAPIDALATATINGPLLSDFEGLTMSWLAVDGMTVDISEGETSLETTFYSPGNLTQTLLIEWTDSGTEGAPFDVTVSVAAVPVPAAGLMLLTALGGAAALRRRK